MQKNALVDIGGIDPTQTQISFGGGSGIQAWHYDPEIYREELARYIAVKDQPINFGDDPYFENLMKTAVNPQFKRFSKTTTRNDLIKLYKKLKLELKTKIHKCHVSVALTADIWSGKAKQDYICVTSHYLDENWNLCKSLLGFRLMEEDHSGYQIFFHICNVLQDYKITDKIISLTLDNASANTSAINFFRDNFPYFESLKFFHQRCACHIINLIVKSGLKKIKENIDNIRSGIAWIVASNPRLAEFGRFCQASNMTPRTFALDTPIRWNSTYLMLESVLPYKELISVFLDSRRSPRKIFLNDWIIAEKFYNFLKTFYDATVRLSGVYYPTSPLMIHTIMEIAFLFAQYKDDTDFEEVINSMELKFKKYWKPIPFIYCLATILDPRIKLIGLEGILETIGESLQDNYVEQMDEIKQNLGEIFVQYVMKYGNQQRPHSPVHMEQQPGKISTWKSIQDKIKKKLNTAAGSSSSSSSSSRSTINNELQQYLSTAEVFNTNAEEDYNNFDVLQYWRARQEIFPILARLAMDVYSVPVSTISSEQTFSASGRIISDRRTSLSPKMVEVITCIRDWERSKHKDQHNVVDDETLESFQTLTMDDFEDDCSSSQPLE